MTEDSKKLKIGDRMPDGSIYAGISPDTSKPMYVSPFDQFAFFDMKSLRYADLDKMSFKEAFETARKKDHHGHKDWRLPSVGELSVLFNNRAVFYRLFNADNANQGGRYWAEPDGYISVYFPNEERCRKGLYGKDMNLGISHGLGFNAARFVRS